MMFIQACGYEESEKYVCSGCIGDEYLQKVIRENGKIGVYSFCKYQNRKPVRHRRMHPLEALMNKIVLIIDYCYISTNGE